MKQGAVYIKDVFCDILTEFLEDQREGQDVTLTGMLQELYR